MKSQMKWTRLAALVRRKIRYKIARGGVFVYAGAADCRRGGVGFGNNLLFLIVAAMLATLLISSLISRLVLAGLELELQLPEHICARTPARAVMRLRNWKRWMPSFSIRVAGSGKEQTLIRALYFR